MKQKIFVNPGDRFGNLVVIKEIEAVYWKKYRKRKVLCKCDCGNEAAVYLSNLTNGHTKSCGCLVVQKLVNHRKTHGQTGTRLYGIWAGMLNRCRNSKVKSYKNYGALGITVCEEWHEFNLFMKWALEHGYQDDLTIERKDPAGNYCPNNCCWIPKSEQAKNKRNSSKRAS
jgi:hypothetical protein